MLPDDEEFEYDEEFATAEAASYAEHVAYLRTRRVEAISEIMWQIGVSPEFDVVEIDGIVHITKPGMEKPTPLNWTFFMDSVLHRILHPETGMGWHKSWNPRRRVRQRRKAFLDAVEIVLATTTLIETRYRD